MALNPEASLITKELPTTKLLEKGEAIPVINISGHNIPLSKTEFKYYQAIKSKLSDFYNQATGAKVRKALGLPTTGSIKGGQVQDFYNQATKGIKEVKPENKITPEVLRQKAKEALKAEASLIKEVPPTTPPPKTSIASLPPDNPIRRIVEYFKGWEGAITSQERLRSKELSKRVGAVAGIGERLKGEQAFFAQLKALKGELPKITLADIRSNFSQQDIDYLFDTIESSHLMPLQKVRAKFELAKAMRGVTPTRSGLELLREVFPEEFVQLAEQVPKATSLLGSIVNLPRTLMASIDVSAPLRQGLFMIGRPREFLPSFIDMFKFLAKEENYQGLMESIVRHPLYELAQKSGLQLTDIEAGLLTKEEMFMGADLAEKIPEIGRMVRASNRAYTGFLNKLRWDSFVNTYNDFAKLGLSKEELENTIMPAMAQFINAATGRGNLSGAWARLAPALNATFFSPRLIASRLNLLNPKFYIDLPEPVRKYAISTMLRSAAVIGTLMTLFAMAGWKVGSNPLSADFGKVRKGNTRLDLTGGMANYIRLGAQILSGKIISSTTGREIRVGEGYKPLTRLQILSRFFESKTSPLASLILDLMRGETFTGAPVTLPAAIIGRFIPMFIADLYDVLREENLSTAEKIIAAGLGASGAGLQTYGTQELVSGVSPIGVPTVEIQPRKTLEEEISQLLFDQPPLEPSKQYNVDIFYQQLKQLPPEEATRIWNQIERQNPQLFKKLYESYKRDVLGITPDDLFLKSLSVNDGSRAKELMRRFSALSTNEEKDALWNEYVRKGIITTDVARQIYIMLGLIKP